MSPNDSLVMCCGNCDCYYEVDVEQQANGLTHRVGVCVYELLHPDSTEGQERPELVNVSPLESACEDYKERH